MSLVPVARELTVDLGRPPALRFAEVQEAMRDEASVLAREGLALLAPLPVALRRAAAALHERLAGPYCEEIASWARVLELPLHDVICLQHMYELAQAGERLWLLKRGALGCTAGIAALDSPLHLRTLDWPMPGLSAATCAVRVRGARQEFVVAGIAGMVGAFSGMVEGAFSVTINYAPPAELPGRGAAPAFLVRRVLESARSYREAVERLQTTALAAPVFFTVCGVRRGEGCVIERTRRGAVVRHAQGQEALGQANLHVSEALRSKNAITRNSPPESLFCSSDERRAALASRLSTLVATPELERLSALFDAPVLNGMTYQAMAFRPASGEYRIWRRS